MSSKPRIRARRILARFPDRRKQYQEASEDLGPAKGVDLLERKEETRLPSYVHRLTFEDGHAVKVNFKLTKKNGIGALDTLD